MMRSSFDFLACPLDNLSLEKRGNSFYCANNHCFDIDRKGAVNLLPVQLKKSKEPGDSKEMVVARQNVLNSELYEPIAVKLMDIVAQEPGVVFDAGCGEGYYTEYVADRLQHEYAVMGMDISKDAIHAAAKRSKEILWCVGTNKKIPVQDASVDVVLCLFGFPVYAEFHRILKPQGRLIMVDPGEDHLIELRRILYPEIKERDAKDDHVDGFAKVDVTQMRAVQIAPNTTLLHDLLMMTPHGYRATEEGRQNAMALSGHDLTLDVVFRVYRKDAA